MVSSEASNESHKKINDPLKFLLNVADLLNFNNANFKCSLVQKTVKITDGCKNNILISVSKSEYSRDF